MQEKPMRRQVAEESLMSPVTFAATVAASHFIPVPDVADADVPPADNVLARKMQQYMHCKTRSRRVPKRRRKKGVRAA